MGKVTKGVQCYVSGCEVRAVRSVPMGKASSAGLKVGTSRGKAYLCSEHWKEYKKAVKKEKRLERWRWG
ncbi:MAG: hypothetical protein GTN80_00935 [Nitrososphaeria archaeon]|nr:hypothetical protein [Nitrososphaeria archaeon]NIN51716.1 hypothetical protein [Nitrososphaeria archaeon]NIQ32210.1 hypothetical protein [Nitrososphaeria archaeon]